jgi:tetratricopeptide (TPR) repeat protein
MVFPPDPQQRALQDVLSGAADRLDAGQPDEAMKVLNSRGGLALENPVGRNMLGEVYLQKGNPAEALRAFDAAVKLAPNFAEAHANRGAALLDLGRLMEALDAERRALRFNPKLAMAHFNRGVVLAALKRRVEAVEAFSSALELRSDYAEALLNRGMAQLELERPLEALADFRRALMLRPDMKEARLALAEAHLAVGQKDNAIAVVDQALEADPGDVKALALKVTVLMAMERHAAALPLVDELVAREPQSVRARHLRFAVVLQLRRFAEALGEADAAIALNPEDPEGHALRAGALSELNRVEESLAALRTAERNGASGHFYQNVRAVLMSDIGDLDEARSSFTRAVELQPDNATYRHNRGMFLLSTGDLEQGWRDHAWRLKDPNRTLIDRVSDAPFWQGEDLAAKRLLILREQGFGDLIQFARFIPEIVQRGAAATLLVVRPLVSLMQRSLPGVDVAESLGFRAAYDYQIPVMSLAYLLNKRLEELGERVPYLAPDPERVAKWRGRVGNDGFKIGIVWQGNPQYFRDPYRSVPLRHFEPLAKIPGMRLISLQAIYGLEQLKALPAGMNVESFGDEIERNPDGIEEVAAVMASLDLVVSSDTVSVHLAGALGRPTWVALRYRPDWRWMLDRADSPWYPTIRLFRQKQHGDWPGVFADIAAALADRVAAGPASGGTGGRR